MENNLLKLVPFASLKGWSVFSSFITHLEGKYPAKKLGDYLRLIKEPIVLDDNTLYKQIRVRTHGQGVVKRKELYGYEINTKKQFIAHKGNLILSKIDARNGAFGIIPDNLEGAIITASFLQYEVIGAIKEYISLVLALDILKEKWQALSSGTTNRQSVNEDKVESFKIPMPSIVEQEEILRIYHAIIAEADENIVKGNNINDGLLYDIQSVVSSLKMQEQKKEVANSIMQTIPFASTCRWEVEYILKEGRLKSVYDSFKYPVYPISDITTNSLFGLSIKATSSQGEEMIPMLRMANIVNGEIRCNELKYLPRKYAVTNKEHDKYLLHKGDLLINRTNSKELVGKAAVFNLEGEYTYASYIIRYRFDTAKVLPEYVNILFMLPIVRIQIDTLSRQTAGQCNINSDEIGAIKIPVPHISEQQAIIEKYNMAKKDANTYYDKARVLKKKAIADFEKAIFV